MEFFLNLLQTFHCRLNALRTLPKTLHYLQSHGWVEMKGYNKIADNTYPNLMAVLTGIDGELSYEACLPIKIGRLDNCSFIWKKFREGNYTTAYGEDEYTISTFNFRKVGFREPPTDYYMRPYIIAAQKELKAIEKHSLKYCLGPTTAGERILNYAEDFATTFRNQSSFGLFWTNSFSHNDVNFPNGMDGVIMKFFRNLRNSGVMERSLVIFFRYVMFFFYFSYNCGANPRSKGCLLAQKHNLSDLTTTS